MVLVDWLPWNHTFGSNYNFNLILQQAGTLYIDGGKPVPALVGQTVQNLREIAPTIYFNVPAGYGALLPFLEKDDALARHFFSRAAPDVLCRRFAAAGHVGPAGSACDPHHRNAGTDDVGLGHDRDVAACHLGTWLLERAGNVGVPVPGVDVKLVPAGNKLEIRVRGPNITPGYWRRPDLTAGDVRRGRLLLAGRCGAFRRSAGSECGLDLRRPHRGGLQAHQRHLGCGRRAACRRHCRRVAGFAGRDRVRARGAIRSVSSPG